MRGGRRARGRGAGGAGVLTAAAMMLLAGCVPSATGPERAGPMADLPEGVRVEITQLRSDVADRQIQARVTNDSDEAVVVGQVHLEDPRFAPTVRRPTDRLTTIKPGVTVDLRLQLRAPVCGDLPADPAGVARVTLLWMSPLGDPPNMNAAETWETSVPLQEVFPFLEELHHRECAAAAVAQSTTISVGPFRPSDRPAPALLQLGFVPQNEDHAVEVTGIRETNLLTFDELEEGSGVYPLDLDLSGGGRGATTVDLPVLPGRCDPHAVQEDKRGTVFTLDVVLNGVPSQVQVAASPELRGDVLAWIAVWCGFPHG